MYENASLIYAALALLGLLISDCNGRSSNNTAPDNAGISAPTTLKLQTIAEGLISPVAFAHASDDCGRIFVTE
jgi:hypothetical protein